ncbi:JAB domain-containing protein [Aquimarina spinulae]|uniref:JAB domain-containing protein n=1 Tax=Aquimarina spinulae TaxID=1192023 RepID=UPI000D55B8C3|nr:JAB domain-containing protein [Aquimarina spinulae]
MRTNNISEIQISYSSHIAKKHRIKIKSSTDAYNVFINSWDQKTIGLQEEFKILLLNNTNEVLGVQNLSKGGISGTYVDVKLLFATALKVCASDVIIAHNHPSGTLIPSDSDIRLTKKIKESGNLLDINLLDHLIITKDGFYSLVDHCKF